MDLKRHLLKFSRGWVPKEPVFDNAQIKSKLNINKEMKETKRFGMGVLDVIGGTLLGLSIYVYLVDPHAWLLAWVTNVSFVVIGVIAIALTIFIWGRARRPMS